LKNNFT
jgi:O-phospho-L-seryl-tRNASec:L-selenocysteinyl-tRNA synthase